MGAEVTGGGEAPGPRDGTTYERFIPVRKLEFQRRLRKDFGFTGAEGKRFDVFCDLLGQLYRHTYEELLNDLEECYAPFNPDAETVTLDRWDDAELERRKARLRERFAELLDIANYEHMTSEDFTRAFNERSAFGIQVVVDTSEYELLDIFYRGVGEMELPLTWLRRLLRKPPLREESYRRLVALVKRADQDCVHIKVFKDIPRNSLETLMPQAHVRMQLLDKLRLGGSGAVGVAFSSIRIAGKAFQFLGSLTVASVVCVLAAALYALKTFIGFKSTKQRYFSNLARRLYSNSLVSNLNVILSAIDLAVVEETQEALLAWCVLNRERELIPREEVKRRAEAYLRDTYGVTVNYEIGDAIGKLVARDLLIDEADGLSVFDLETSVRKLDHLWDGLYEG